MANNAKRYNSNVLKLWLRNKAFISTGHSIAVNQLHRLSAYTLNFSTTPWGYVWNVSIAPSILNLGRDRCEWSARRPTVHWMERRWALEPVRAMWGGDNPASRVAQPTSKCYGLLWRVRGVHVSHARPRARESMKDLLSLQICLNFYFRFADIYSVPRITETVGTGSETP